MLCPKDVVIIGKVNYFLFFFTKMISEPFVLYQGYKKSLKNYNKLSSTLTTGEIPITELF